MNQLETLREIVRRIEEFNRELGENAIPTSDDLYRRHMSDLAESEDQLFFLMRSLQDAHFLFAIHIIEPDPNKGTRGVFGYVVADPAVMQPLVAEYNRKLENVYEAQMGKRKGAITIVRELMARVKELQNTPLGKILLLCVMLDQFSRLIAEKPDDYNAYWREVKLRQLMPEFQVEQPLEMEEEATGEEALREGAGGTRRAVDTLEYQDLSRMDLSGSWGKSVEKYGVTFLLRIHLRKHDFETIKRLILNRRIAREDDLRYLRDTLRVMEDRYNLEKELTAFIGPIRELKRLAQMKINQFSLIRKKFEEDLDI